MEPDWIYRGTFRTWERWNFRVDRVGRKWRCYDVTGALIAGFLWKPALTAAKALCDRLQAMHVEMGQRIRDDILVARDAQQKAQVELENANLDVEWTNSIGLGLGDFGEYKEVYELSEKREQAAAYRVRVLEKQLERYIAQSYKANIVK